jgi:hypothetical protein
LEKQLKIEKSQFGTQFLANNHVTDDLVEKKLITKHGTYAGGKVNEPGKIEFWIS